MGFAGVGFGVGVGERGCGSGGGSGRSGFLMVRVVLVGELSVGVACGRRAGMCGVL